MTDTEQKDFLIADWRVLPAEGLLRRGDEVEHLEPRAMDVLVYLASRPGQVVTREELERDVWRGAVIGYDAVTNTVIKLRKALRDNAKQPQYIVTIPKKGYQLIADLRQETDFTHQQANTQDASTNEDERKPSPGFKLLIPVLLVIGLVALIMYWFAGSKTDEALPSIIVLPFVSLNEDQQQENLADGMTEDITTDLSRVSNIRVLAGNTALRYKSKQVSPEDVGEELGVGFVLKGSIRRLGGELRLNVQLVDTSTGYNMWAERYDRKVNEVFAVQDEVTQKIVSSLAVKLSSQEKQRLARRTTDSLKAYDYFQEGQQLYKINTLESSRQANDMYRKAIELDPGYGRAYGAQAVNLAMEYRRGWSDSPNVTLDRALELSKKAVELDDSIPQTYWALGFVHLTRKEFEKAKQAAMTSVEIAPNYADGYGLIALIESYMGKADQAIELNDKAISLNPYYSYEYLNTYGIAHYTQGSYQQAIEALEASQARNPNHILVKLLLAASYVKAGRQADSEWVVTEIQVLSPNLNLAMVANNIPFARAEDTRSLIADLRAAGLPE